MATVIDVEETGPELAQLYDRAAAGEEIVIARGAGPKMTLVELDAPRPSGRRFGVLKGLIRTEPADFAPLTDEELKDWGY